MKIKKAEPVIIRTTYSQKELDSLLHEMNGNISNESRTSWLLKNHAVSFKSSIVAGKEIKDLYVIRHSDGSFPYVTLSEKWAALRIREDQKERALGDNKHKYEDINSQVISLFRGYVV